LTTFSRSAQCKRSADLSGSAFFLDVGISSTLHIARFWRLHESVVEKPHAAAPISASTQTSTNGRAFIVIGAAADGPHGSTEPPFAEEERQTSYPLDSNTVIAAAFRAAGLPIPEVPKALLGATARRTRPDHRGGVEGRGTRAELVEYKAPA
jgi:hypothetical protein